MQSAGARGGTDAAVAFYGPHCRRILVEREMRAVLIIVAGIAVQDAAQVRRVENDNMIEAFAPDRADQPFGMAVLPR